MFKNHDDKKLKAPNYETVSAAFTKEINATMKDNKASQTTVFAVNAAITKSTKEAVVPVNYKAFGEVIKKSVGEALKSTNATPELVAAVDASIDKVVKQFDAEPHVSEPKPVVHQNKDGWGNEYPNSL